MTGWTWEYIAEWMTLERLYQLTAYWIEHPPPHVSLGSILTAFTGPRRAQPLPEELRAPEFKPPDDREQPVQLAVAAQQLGGEVIRGIPPWLKTASSK